MFGWITHSSIKPYISIITFLNFAFYTRVASLLASRLEAVLHEAAAKTHEAEARTHEVQAKAHEADTRFFGAKARPWGLTSLPWPQQQVWDFGHPHASTNMMAVSQHQ